MFAGLLLMAVLSTSEGAPSVSRPGDAELDASWKKHGDYCETDLELTGPSAHASRTLEQRGITPLGARHLLMACAAPYDAATGIPHMRSALAAGASAAVSIEVRRLLAAATARGELRPEHRALLGELVASERVFAEALMEEDQSSLEKLSLALKSLPEDAPPSARDERKLCLAAAFVRAWNVNEAAKALPETQAYPHRRHAIELQIAARTDDFTRLTTLLADLGKGEHVSCERAFYWTSHAAVRSPFARAPDPAGRSAPVDRVEPGSTPFDAYLAHVRSTQSGVSRLRGPALLARLGRPDLAMEHLNHLLKFCVVEGGAPCADILEMATKLHPLAEKRAAAPPDAALMARLSPPARWRSYAVVAAPPRESAPSHHAPLTLPNAEVVFSAREGRRAVAVVTSYAVDPPGLGRGGYLVYLSESSGKSWRGPFHSGFASGFPFRVKEATKAIVFDGDVLQLPVDVEEIAPESIRFSLVELRTLREEHDRLVRIPLAVLEQDSDGDKLTDLLEERLGTDPAKADTDGDGIPDARDQLPLESGTTLSPEARFSAVAVLDEHRSVLVHEPHSTDLKFARVTSTSGPLRTTFMRQAVDTSGLMQPGRTIRFSDEALRAYVKKLGVIDPLQVEVVVDGRRAIVKVERSRRATTYFVEESPDGTMTHKKLIERTW